MNRPKMRMIYREHESERPEHIDGEPHVKENRQNINKLKRDKRQFKKICELAIQYEFCYCYLFGQPIRPGQKWNIDHIQPACQGGQLEPGNVRPVHYDCNQAKSDLTLEQFREMQLKDKVR